MIVGMLPTTVFAAGEITTGNAKVTAPVAGQTPSFTATSDEPEKYSVKLLRWVDVEKNKNITSSDLTNPASYYYNYTFKGGKEYIAIVKFTAVGDNTLSYDNSFTINGETTYWDGNGLKRCYRFTATGTGGEHIHSYGSDWKNDADNHWHECSCGDKKDTAAHTAGEWVIDTPATATKSGTKHKECTVCGYMMATETIPATGGGEGTEVYSATVADINITLPAGYTSKHINNLGEDRAIKFTNTGTETLYISEPTLSGTNASDFSVRTFGKLVVAPGNTNKTAYAIDPKIGLAPGTYTATISCTDDNNKLSAPVTAKVTLTVSDHNWDTSKWEFNPLTHWHKCTDSGCSAKGDEAAHNSDKVVGAKSATFDTDGYTGDKYCSICDRKMETGKAIAAEKYIRESKATMTPAGIDNTISANDLVFTSLDTSKYTVGLYRVFDMTDTTLNTVGMGYPHDKKFISGHKYAIEFEFEAVDPYVYDTMHDTHSSTFKLNDADTMMSAATTHAGSPARRVELVAGGVGVATYDLTTSVNGGHGTISAGENGITEGTSKIITFTPDSGYEIDKVMVNGTETTVTGNTLTVSMDGNKNVVVTYKAIEYTITVTDGKATVGAGSEISKAAEGTAVTLTANAAPSDKVFDKWEVVSGGITLADVNSATTIFIMPAEAVSVKATYKNAPHTHTYNQETVKPEALKTPADCTRNAVYFKSCSCGAISTTDTFVAMDTALGHAYGSDWKYDSTNHWHECSRCHDKKDEAAHDYGSDNVCDTCGYDKTVPHTHNLTLVAAKAATCTTAGNSAYYTCDGCDKWFEDATGSVEITDKTSVKIPAPGHTAGTEWKSDDTNHWHECTVAGCGVIIESTKSAHTAGEWIVDTPATATTSGTKHKECTVCHRVLETQTIPSTGTELKIIAGDNQIYNKASGSDVTITCNGDFAKFTGIKVDGSVVDSSNYTAVSGSTVLTLKASYLDTLTAGSHTVTFVYTGGEANANLTIEAAGSGHTHSYGTEWKNNSDKHWHECSCGNKKDEAVHTASEWITDKEATATTDGAKHKECTVCGYVMETGTIPATGTGHTHNYGSDWKSDSTNHWKECSCGDKKDTAAHDFKWVVDKEATATKKGSKHEECKTCGYKRPAVEIPATGTTTAPTDTTKPNDTTKPGNTNGSENSPQTGDNSNIFLWFALLFVSVAGVTGITVYNKKKKEHAE